MKNFLRSRFPPPLTETELNLFSLRSNLSLSEVRDFYERFVHCYPLGYLTIDDFRLYLKEILFRQTQKRIDLDRYLLKNFFRRLDKDQDQRLNFDEFFNGNLFMHQSTDSDRFGYILKLTNREKTKFYSRIQILENYKNLLILFNLSHVERVVYRVIKEIIKDQDHHGLARKMSWTSVCLSIEQKFSIVDYFSTSSTRKVDHSQITTL